MLEKIKDQQLQVNYALVIEPDSLTYNEILKYLFLKKSHHLFGLINENIAFKMHHSISFHTVSL